MDTDVAIFVFVILPIVNLISCFAGFRVYSNRKQKRLRAKEDMI